MIVITLNAYDLEKIQNSYDQLKSLVSILEGNLTPIFRFPQRKKRISLLKSPHVNNKAKEQFEWIQYKGQCKLTWNKNQIQIERLIHLFLLGLSYLSFPGTQLNIKTSFQTSSIQYGAKL